MESKTFLLFALLSTILSWVVLALATDQNELLHSIVPRAPIPCNCCTCDEVKTAMTSRWLEAMMAFGVCEQYDIYDSFIAPGAFLVPQGLYDFPFPIKFDEAAWASFSCNDTRRERNQVHWVVGNCETQTVVAAMTIHYMNVTNPALSVCRNVTGTGYLYRFRPCEFQELRFEAPHLTDFFPCGPV